MRYTAARLAGTLLIVATFQPTGQAASLPAGFSETLVASGLSNPTAMAFAPDGRLFVCLQGGQLRVIKEGALLPTPFLTVSVSSTGERGLLGVAFDPDFTVNQFVYVYYTATTPAIHNRLSRFTASGDVAVAGSETVILELDNLSTATNHNGGAIHFGPDGKLYIAVGDNANGANAQSLNNLLGKMLRLNPDGTIPTDNPFYAQAVNRNRAIWALGLRNPFTFDIQPLSGRIFINDVGEGSWEEINEGVVGSNYGWPTTEGFTMDPQFRSPVYAYPHSGGTVTGCAITGGAFYNPAVGQFPSDFHGRYFFADYCGGWINLLNTADYTVTGFATGISAPVDLKVGPDGSLYYLARGAGAIFRVSYTGDPAPIITQHPSDQTVSAGQPATFSVQASGAQFRCVVSNAFGSATSNNATLTVSGSGHPTATITSPTQGTLYTGGMNVTYAGTASDAEDGALPPSAFTWRVDFHHDSHVHPFLPATTGASGGTFTIPRTGETSTNVWYRIHVSVTDSSGQTFSTFRDIHPRVVSLTLTERDRLPLTLDGQPVSTPFTFASVVGMIRTIGAPLTQTKDGFTYTFRSWSDGGAATHDIVAPASATTYTARYQRHRNR
jgi:glucose/arabinose dehydrogenase